MEDSPPIATVVNGHTFTVDRRYILTDSKILGKGSFGVVCTAYDNIRKINLAIKRIRPYANDEWDARHCLREIRLLKLLGPHPNIITLFELSLFEEKTELYMAMEVMDCDLHRVIQSKQPLSEKHHKCFIKQMLEGIKAMHSIGVFHRDLKPGNILVSKDCQLRITDFGLARFMDDSTRSGSNQENPMTEYVVTRWYRCPEILLSPNKPYSEAIDLWSIGCILAELIKRKPLFPGKSHANQVQLIFEVMGFNDIRDLGFPISPEATSFLDKRCKFKKQSLTRLLPSASSQGVELLEALLSVNPKDRPSAEMALFFPYMMDDVEVLHDYTQLYLARPSKEFFDFETEKQTVPYLQKMIHTEVKASLASNYSLSQPESHEASSTSSQVPSAEVKAATIGASGNGKSAQRRLSNAGESNDETDGPASQLATAFRQSNMHEVLAHSSSNDAGDRDVAVVARTGSDVGTGPTARAPANKALRRAEKSERSENNPFRKGATESISRSNDAVAAGVGGVGVNEAIKSTDIEHKKEIMVEGKDVDQYGNNAVWKDVEPPSNTRSTNLSVSDTAALPLPASAPTDMSSRSAPIQSDNILVAMRGGIGTGANSGGGRSAFAKPKSPRPSPKKMEEILQKDLNNKKRFLQQGYQKQQQREQIQQMQQQQQQQSVSAADYYRRQSEQQMEQRIVYSGSARSTGGSSMRSSSANSNITDASNASSAKPRVMSATLIGQLQSTYNSIAGKVSGKSGSGKHTGGDTSLRINGNGSGKVVSQSNSAQGAGGQGASHGMYLRSSNAIMNGGSNVIQRSNRGDQ